MKTSEEQKVTILEAVKAYSGLYLNGANRYVVALVLDKLSYEFKRISNFTRYELKMSFGPIGKAELRFMEELDHGGKAIKLPDLLEDIALALFHHIGKQQKISTKFHATENFSSKDEMISLRIYTPRDEMLSTEVSGLISQYVYKKHKLVDSTKEGVPTYMKYSQPILHELQTNRFIDTENVPLVSLDDIRKYLNGRLTKDARIIHCKHCKKKAYVTRENRQFCYNKSCKVLSSVSKKKGAHNKN